MKQKSSILGVVYAIISSATFGLIPLFSIPLLKAGIGSPTILFYRFMVAAAMMALIVAVTRRKFRLRKEQLWVVTLLAVLYALTAILLLSSYQDIPSGMATTIHFLYPLAVTLAMSVIFREPTSRITYVAVVVSLLGVALLAWGGHSGGHFERGVMLALMTVATYAAYIIAVMKSRVSRIDSLTLTFYVLVIGAMLFALYALATTGIEAIHSGSAWLNILLVALLCTVLSDYTLILAIKRIGATATSILGTMEPLTAVITGVLCFGEHFDNWDIVGLVLIVVSVVLVVAKGTNSK